jgi:PHD-like zinc-binding domain
MQRCSACTTFEHKAHGAPIQCAKGKCSKALHVTCAEQGKANASFRVVQIQETEVLINVDAAATVPTASTSESRHEVAPASLISVSGAVEDGGTHRVLKTIQKYVVEALCGLHNPVRAVTLQIFLIADHILS